MKSNASLRPISWEEFHALKIGDTVYIKTDDTFHAAQVTRPAFYNSDADEPDWEVETTNGFSDCYSLYVR